MRLTWKLILALIIASVVGGTLVSATTVSVTIQCAGTISYESVNSGEDANDEGNNSSGTFDYTLENIDESNRGDMIEKSNIVEEKKRHLRLRP